MDEYIDSIYSMFEENIKTFKDDLEYNSLYPGIDKLKEYIIFVNKLISKVETYIKKRKKMPLLDLEFYEDMENLKLNQREKRILHSKLEEHSQELELILQEFAALEQCAYEEINLDIYNGILKNEKHSPLSNHFGIAIARNEEDVLLFQSYRNNGTWGTYHQNT